MRVYKINALTHTKPFIYAGIATWLLTIKIKTAGDASEEKHAH